MSKKIITCICMLVVLIAACAGSFAAGRATAPKAELPVNAALDTPEDGISDEPETTEPEITEPELPTDEEPPDEQEVQPQVEYLILDSFWAKVVSFEHGFLVEGLDRNDINYRGSYILNLSENVEITQNDIPISLDDIEVGDSILVSCSGVKIETDPAILEDVLFIRLYK